MAYFDLLQYIIVVNVICFLKMRWILLISLFLEMLFPKNGWGANLKIREVETTLSGNTLSVSCKLSWDNSWRDNYNWDAVWIFAKINQGGDWKPLLLQNSGHVVGDLGYSLGSSSNGAVGMFIFRPGVSSGNIVDVPCRLLFLNSGITQDMLDSGDVGILVQGIEMVYIPWGRYVVGDGSSANTLAGSITELNTLSATYPNGYKGFYMMKYELSQEQYVNFLNTLTLAEQESLLGNPDALKEGDYVFGSPGTIDHRNGIILYKRNGTSGRLFFACNYNRHVDLPLSEDVNQEDDGQNIACNYVGINDLLGYASWSGLRPMSEYEYEKSCRGVMAAGISGEYAWNQNNGATQAASIINEGMEDEFVASGNVNYGNRLSGPVRCGAFGQGTVTQVGSGSGYWGVMELSGNLRELCCNHTGLNSFSRDKHGNGEYNPELWDAMASGVWGSRGGGYSSDLSQLHISDRSDIVTSGNREPYLGIRCVRTFEASNVGLNPGTIAGPGRVVCACEGKIVITNNIFASIAGIENSLPIAYKWYVNNVEQSGKNGADFTYTLTGSVSGVQNYTFVRKAFCGVGEESTSVVVTVAGNPFETVEQTFSNSGSANTLQVTNKWTSAIPQKWTILSVEKGSLTISNTGLLSGLSQTVCGGTGIIVEAKCIGGSGCTYTKKIRETGTRSFYSDSRVNLLAGTYTVRCYGGEGGYGKNSGGTYKSGRPGGYAYGQKSYTSQIICSLNVGGRGASASGIYGGSGGSSSYGAGGTGGNGTTSGNRCPGGGGGGATAVYLENVLALVAGGGGGGNGGTDATAYGGVGGGSGSDLTAWNSKRDISVCGGCMGSTQGGSGGSNHVAGGGGGGGYKGGNGGTSATATQWKKRWATGGGGGSGYVRSGYFSGSGMSNGSNYGSGSVQIVIN